MEFQSNSQQHNIKFILNLNLVSNKSSKKRVKEKAEFNSDSIHHRFMMGIQKFTKRANPHIIMHRQFMKWISSCMPKSFYLKHKKTKIINMLSKTRCRSLLIQLFMSNFIFPFHSAHFVEENNSLLSLVLHSRAPAFFFLRLLSQ